MSKHGFDRLSAVQRESVHSVPVAEEIRAGGVRPAAPKTKHILGKMFLDCFFSGGLPPGFHAAV
jgi:hypothetical protein